MDYSLAQQLKDAGFPPKGIDVSSGIKEKDQWWFEIVFTKNNTCVN